MTPTFSGCHFLCVNTDNCYIDILIDNHKNDIRYKNKAEV